MAKVKLLVIFNTNAYKFWILKSISRTSSYATSTLLTNFIYSIFSVWFPLYLFRALVASDPLFTVLEDVKSFEDYIAYPDFFTFHTETPGTVTFILEQSKFNYDVWFDSSYSSKVSFLHHNVINVFIIAYLCRQWLTHLLWILFSTLLCIRITLRFI
jgi:hypothetical protein